LLRTRAENRVRAAEKRLFYDGVTRAKVLLLYPTDQTDRRNGPSRFLKKEVGWHLLTQFFQGLLFYAEDYQMLRALYARHRASTMDSFGSPFRRRDSLTTAGLHGLKPPN
jgi:hypothetical protein